MRALKMLLLISIFTLLVSLSYYTITTWERAKVEAYTDLTSLVVLEASFNRPFFFSKNSVGNEWEYAAKVNDKLLTSSASITIEVNAQSVINVAACAKENDTVPDVGCKEGKLSVSSINLLDGSDFELLLLVTENRGRYSGNTAKIPFSINFKRIVMRDEIQNRFWNITKNYLRWKD